MESRKRFIGLIGLGYLGKNILRNLYDLGDTLHAAECVQRFFIQGGVELA